MKKIIVLILLCCFSTYAKTVSDSVSSHLSSLNEEQKRILYELAVLEKNGFSADEFWMKHKNEFPKLDDQVRDQLALEIFANSQILYTPPKDSAIQFWIQAQSLANWMFYLSAFIAICAVVALFKRYWNLLVDFVIKNLAPLFRFLFSPILLTYELLIAGILCVYFGVCIEEFVLRTVVVHVGLCLLWSQSTAIFTKEYLIKRYIVRIEDDFWSKSSWEAVKTISLPALCLTLALVYVLYTIPQDVFYNYEIVLSGIATIYALPFWRNLEKYLYPVLFPFKNDTRARGINSLGGCTVIAIGAIVVLIFQENFLFCNVISALMSLLAISFLILSLKMNYRYDFRNYYYLQLITALFLGLAFWYGFNNRLNEIVWFSLIGTSIYIIIKYFEIFSFFSDWKRSKAWAWKLLGTAVLLWLLAKGILNVSKIIYQV
ncbi:hypothetical protein [Flavobacterium sp. HBTb2-11-1]|uniref:hypothetical protein n=1 Tax=Flavobacterium sp. HBTb2-11-1 TaxID=2692212 RepID=UPI001F28AE65|nr:hypothetical protein [Flavobacterium sp. HBTb2-11-1]